MPLRSLIIAVGLVLCGCGARHTVRAEAVVEAPEAFSAAVQSGIEPLDERWWTAFDDPGLNEVVDAALDQNLALRAAYERIRAADAVVARERGGRRPEVDATASAGYGPSQFERDGWRAGVGMQASYEIDLWGRVRAGVRAEQARADAIAADYEAAAISLAAETSLAWLQLAAFEEILATIDEQLALNETTLRLLERRFEGGAGNASEVLRQRALVSSTQQERDITRTDRDVAAQALTVLLGRPSATPPTYPPALPVLPALPEAGVPGEVIARRPDVRRALFELEAAEQDAAVAAAERLPRFSLTAGLNSGTSGAENIFREWTLSVLGGVLAPIFHGGALRAEQERAVAVRDERWYTYGEAVLAALVDVETAIARERGEIVRADWLHERVTLLTAALGQLEHQFFNGTADYIDVLTARGELQRLERELIVSRWDQLNHRVALYRAIAGGITEASTGTPTGAPPDDPSQEP